MRVEMRVGFFSQMETAGALTLGMARENSCQRDRIGVWAPVLPGRKFDLVQPIDGQQFKPDTLVHFSPMCPPPRQVPSRPSRGSFQLPMRGCPFSSAVKQPNEIEKYSTFVFPLCSSLPVPRPGIGGNDTTASASINFIGPNQPLRTFNLKSASKRRNPPDVSPKKKATAGDDDDDDCHDLGDWSLDGFEGLLKRLASTAWKNLPRERA